MDIQDIEALRGNVDFNLPTREISDIIKIIGIGGGGGNAANQMFRSCAVQGITYLLCNTDAQDLSKSPLPEGCKICLGPTVTRGLGAGNDPNLARLAAEESRQEILRAITSDKTEMVFITAGMGGGTGTGAAPVIAQIAREAGKLTVGIVTIPFEFEGAKKILQALHGLKDLEREVDAVIVVNNQRLVDIYGNESFEDSMARADATLSNAAKSISDIVYTVGTINRDFADVRRTLKGGGTSIISTGFGEGPTRLKDAIDDAFRSPLVNNNKMHQAKSLLVYIYTSPESKLNTEESNHLRDFTQKIEYKFDFIWGKAERTDLKPDQVAVTVLASGFNAEQTHESVLSTLSETERKEIEERDQALLEEYYPGISSPKTIEPLILGLDDLEDEELLGVIERTPACRRDMTIVRSLREARARRQAEVAQVSKHAEATPRRVEPSSSPEPEHGDDNVIMFD